uniref:MATH domain-containing protein n=1 Tax=Globodera rostochiensis TaxID=31243 RepID=A0A914HQJ8_GLORO
MEPSKNQSSSNTGGDQAKDNKYKRSGQILFQMPKFKAFSEGRGSKTVFSSPVVYINGLPWRIKIQHRDAYVGIFMNCFGDETDAAWSCRVAAQYSVVSFKQTGEYLMKKGELDSFDIFSAEQNWGWNEFIKFMN